MPRCSAGKVSARMACSLGGQSAAAQALQHAEKDQQGQAGREAAQQRADGEQRHAGHVEALAARSASRASREMGSMMAFDTR